MYPLYVLLSASLPVGKAPVVADVHCTHPVPVNKARLIARLAEKPREFAVPQNQRRHLVKDLREAPITKKQLVALCVWLSHAKTTATAALCGKAPYAGSLANPSTAAVFIEKVSNGSLVFCYKTNLHSTGSVSYLPMSVDSCARPLVFSWTLREPG